MVTALLETMGTNGCDTVTPGNDLSLKIEAEAMAEFDRLNELVEEIRQANKELPDCEEYLKMVSGKPYRVMCSPELQARKLRARKFCFEYNLDRIPDDPQVPEEKMYQALRSKRGDALRGVLRGIGDKPVIEIPFNFQYGCNVTIGDGLYANVNLRIFDGARVTVGNRVLFGPNVTIVTETHDKAIQPRREGIVYARPVSIGDDCWIGLGATVLPGVTIGNGCTIGAGSLVTKNIPAFSVAYGVPARVVEEVEDPDAS